MQPGEPAKNQGEHPEVGISAGLSPHEQRPEGVHPGVFALNDPAASLPPGSPFDPLGIITALRNAYRQSELPQPNQVHPGPLSAREGPRPKTKVSRQFGHGPLRVQIDTPQIGIISIVKKASVVSGWAVNLQAHSAAEVRIVIGKTPQPTPPKPREDVRSAFAPVHELPLATGFANALELPVGVYRMRIEVKGTDGSWIPVRRTLLLRVPGASRAQQVLARPLSAIQQLLKRRSSKQFDARWYLSRNPDVAMSGMDPSEHYRVFGAKEGRRPTPEPFLPRTINEMRKWWGQAFGFMQSETKVSRQFVHGPLRVQIDTPQIGIISIVNKASVVSGWAVNLQAHSAAEVRIVIGKTPRPTPPKPREDVRSAFAPVHELPLATGFANALELPVGVYRMRIEAKGTDGSWIPVRRTLLLRIPGASRAQQKELSYGAWVRLEQKRLKAEMPQVERHIEVMVHKPTFTVVVDTRQGSAGLQDTIQSIRRQLYPLWDVRVLSSAPQSALPADVKTLNDASLADTRGDFIVFIQSGQRLAPNALYEFAAAINQHPDTDLVYGDEDALAASGSRRAPFHKPAWSPDYLETFNYVGFPACFRAASARGCFDNAHMYDFVLRFTERTTRVLHVPKILGHGVEKVSVGEAASANAVDLDIKALQGRLSRTGRRGSVCEHELHKGCYVVRLDLQRSPLVSVVIPTAGRTVTVGGRQLDLIGNLTRQIRDNSSYKNIEIIVVDNGDLSPAQLRKLAEAECKRITYCESVFNIAKKLNLGVSLARGELLLLLNDDIEILTPSWIERLVEHFEKPHVGVVGAKLLYPSRETQHVGVVQPFGNPQHVRRGFPSNDAGYHFSTCGVRNYSAVTGAVMMTPASVYREVGGYSDELAVSFNDVDFCMKVRRKGLSVVYAPSVELIHMESMSHVVSLDMNELVWFHKQWPGELGSDPFYNERFLAVEPPTFEPRVNRRML